MRYLILTFALLCAFQAQSETVSGRITKVRENVAYLQTADGKKIPLILSDKTFYRKKKVPAKSRRTVNNLEIYQPLMARGDDVVLTYDADSVDESTGAVQALDILITVD